jgi:hypothetical protein
MFDEPHVWDILQAAAIENILHRSQAIPFILVTKLPAYSAIGTFLIWCFLGEALYVYISTVFWIFLQVPLKVPLGQIGSTSTFI